MLVDDGDGDAFGCVRLLLTELAAALHVEPGWQGQQGAGGSRSRAVQQGATAACAAQARDART
eukprot:2140605-Prymnesium_polylepis.1